MMYAKRWYTIVHCVQTHLSTVSVVVYQAAGSNQKQFDTFLDSWRSYRFSLLCIQHRRLGGVPGIVIIAEVCVAVLSQ